MPLARLTVENLDKSFSAPVLKNVNLAFAAGEVHAIVGENGAGKSTLVNILGGNLLPDAGRMCLDGVDFEPQVPNDAFRAGISCAAQELSTVGTLTAAENISIRNFPRARFTIDRKELNRKGSSQLARVGLGHVAPGTPAAKLSIADRQLLEFAKATAFDCTVLILDEPTAALPSHQADHLHRVIAEITAKGAAVIYISHRLEDVLSISQRVSVLRDGEVVATNFTDQFSASILVELMTGRPRDEPSVRPNDPEADNPVLVAECLTTAALPEPISFSCRQGEILGIAGLAGSGRSELLSALFGLEPPTGGQVSLNVGGASVVVDNAAQMVRLGVGYLGEDRQSMGIYAGQSLLFNMMLPGHRDTKVYRRICRQRERVVGTTLIDKLEIRCNGLQQPVNELSGGNQQKALIARWLHSDANVMLLDEPTQGVDVATKLAIYDILFDFQSMGKSVVLVSSEIDELTTVCNRILVLSNRQLVAIFRRADWSEQRIAMAAFSAYSRSGGAENIPGAQLS